MGGWGAGGFGFSGVGEGRGVLEGFEVFVGSGDLVLRVGEGDGDDVAEIVGVTVTADGRAGGGTELAARWGCELFDESRYISRGATAMPNAADASPKRRDGSQATAAVVRVRECLAVRARREARPGAVDPSDA